MSKKKDNHDQVWAALILAAGSLLGGAKAPPPGPPPQPIILNVQTVQSGGNSLQKAPQGPSHDLQDNPGHIAVMAIYGNSMGLQRKDPFIGKFAPNEWIINNPTDGNNVGIMHWDGSTATSISVPRSKLFEQLPTELKLEAGDLQQFDKISHIVISSAKSAEGKI